MIHKEEFSKLLVEERDLMLKQLDGLSQADSLLQPQPGGNCLNWVVGHLVVNLADILTTLDGRLPADLPNLEHYGFGSEPVLGEGPGVLNLSVLLESYAQLTTIIADRLAQMAETDFDEEIEFYQGNNRRGYVAFFFFFHHSYHIGQLEQLRNLAGRTEKVI
jgi:hypothetical protein